MPRGFRLLLPFERVRRIFAASPPDADLLAPITQELRAWPWLCDLQGHVNNARYLDLLSGGRLEWLLRNGLLRAVLRQRLALLVAGISGVYRRPIPRLAAFTLQTRVAAYDERWLYYEQTFLLGGPQAAGMVAARFLTRSVLRAPGTALGLRESLRGCGVELPRVQPQPPADLEAWSAAQAASLELIRARDPAT